MLPKGTSIRTEKVVVKGRKLPATTEIKGGEKIDPKARYQALRLHSDRIDHFENLKKAYYKKGKPGVDEYLEPYFAHIEQKTAELTDIEGKRKKVEAEIEQAIKSPEYASTRQVGEGTSGDDTPVQEAD
jgi:hypothetical protein